ncbi:hypothetical protein [Streptomyces sp. NPDC050388]|uniref:hypothetical protein n=1 Tax=Streptomyces sp. NPDC050388 TaxID=3155781 RepID=UPI00341F1301
MPRTSWNSCRKRVAETMRDGFAYELNTSNTDQDAYATPAGCRLGGVRGPAGCAASWG